MSLAEQNCPFYSTSFSWLWLKGLRRFISGIKADLRTRRLRKKSKQRGTVLPYYLQTRRGSCRGPERGRYRWMMQMRPRYRRYRGRTGTWQYFMSNRRPVYPGQTRRGISWIAGKNSSRPPKVSKFSCHHLLKAVYEPYVPGQISALIAENPCLMSLNLWNAVRLFIRNIHLLKGV